MPVEEAAEVEATVAATVNSLAQFLNNLHQEWSRTIDAIIACQLDQTLIAQVGTVSTSQLCLTFFP